MSAKYWIKLYHEILDDPKMGMLPDNVYRRCIEIFLLAGRLDDDGNLPCTTELCWMLRQRPETFEPELNQLETVGILTRTKTGWLVTNFEKRQSAVTDAGRMKEYRKRLKKSGQNVTQPLPKSYDSVTFRNTDTDTDTDTDINYREGIKGGASVGNLSPLSQKILDICKLDLEVVKRRKSLREDFLFTAKFLTDKGVSLPAVSEFDEWRQSHHWTKAGTIGLMQMCEFWPQYEDWVKAGKPAYQRQNGANSNGKHKSATVGQPISQEEFERQLRG